MVFRRRTPPNLLQKLRALVLPPGGWGRALRYLRHRASRLPDEPHRIARGIACGVFASFTPLFGLHFFLAVFMDWVTRGNVVASLIGTAAGNPLTFPFIAVLSIDLGHMILDSRPYGVPVSQIMTAFGQAGDEIFRNIRAIFGAEEMRWDRLERFFRGVFLPYLVGGMVPGTIGAFVSYWLSVPALKAYQKLRSVRREARMRKLAAKAAQKAEEESK